MSALDDIGRRIVSLLRRGWARWGERDRLRRRTLGRPGLQAD